MSKTHYTPYFGRDLDQEVSDCGTVVGEYEFYVTTNWDLVTCKRCLKQKEKLLKNYTNEEKDQLNQMSSYVDYSKAKGGNQ